MDDKTTAINAFLKLRRLAVIGVSRSGSRFGSIVFRTLRKRGFTVYPVNSNPGHIDGVPFATSLLELAGKIDGIVLVIPPKQTMVVLREATSLGIKNIWLQQGSESREGVVYCAEHGISAVSGECIMMYTEHDVFPHSWHRMLNRIFGRFPRGVELRK